MNREYRTSGGKVQTRIAAGQGQFTAVLGT